MWKQGAMDEEELEPVKKLQRAWTEVKLPNIPIELPTSAPPSPRSRPVSRATRRPTENCLYCSNQACKALHQAEAARGKSSHNQPKRHKDTILKSVHVTNSFFGGVEIQPIAPPRPRLESSQGTRLKPKESKDDITIGSGWEPFSCVCNNCGEKFGKHSIAIHEKRCSKHQQKKALQERQTSIRTVNSFEGTTVNSEMQKVATIVTMGLASGPEKTTVYAAMPPGPRPHTRTIRHSSLRSNGVGMPTAAAGSKFQETESSVQCDQCQQIVAADRLSIHKRLCQPNVSSLSSCDVIFPSNLLRVDKATKETASSPRRQGGKPPSKVCYICGREFGSLSITIHEPQCLKKWRTENRKLPISERKPLPRKNADKPTIVRALSKDGPEILDSLPDCIYKDERLTERIVQRYYQNCYSQFEQDLLPCKKCGRTFAPERHKLHQQNCNAKPLVRNIS